MTAPRLQPTAEQQAIIDAYAAGKHLVIEAGAGTGKTSTLRLLANATPDRSGVYIAYNRAIANDAKRSFPRHVHAATAHSLAFRAVGRRYAHRLNGPRIPAAQTARLLGITRPLLISPGRTVPPAKVARLVTDTITRFCHSADPELTRWHVPARVPGLDDPAAVAVLREAILPLARRAWADLVSPNGRLRFSHDHYLKAWQLSSPVLEADVVLLDEAQDANSVVADIVTRQHHAQRILVGDSCQPAGTLVTVVRRYRRGNRFTGVLPTETAQVPIEQVQRGDIVVSYDLAHRYLRRQGSGVAGVSSRLFQGELVTIRTHTGLTSRYTPDHHCVIRFGDDLVNKHVVYLMRRGEDYRIGVTGARVESQGKRLGLVMRALHEGADAVWILSVHDTRAQAALAEMATAWRFNIPTVTFRTTSSSLLSQERLDDFWRQLGGNRDAAQVVLASHGRDINYPLWHQGERSLQTRRPTVVRACNLIDGMEVLPLTGAMLADGKGISRRHWTPITVGREPYSGPVYSMTVDRDRTYVGDGILTHNCQAIYGWRGAIDAMRTFPADVRLTLSQSFRFGPAIAAEANKILALLDAPLRLRGHDPIASRLASLEEPEAVLCRTNAEAIAQVMAATEQGRTAALVGSGAEIRRLAEAAIPLKAGRGTDHPELMAFRTWREVQEYVEQDTAGRDLKVAVGLIDTHGPDTIIATIDALEPDEAMADVVVSTAHKAKGREWDTVRIADDFQPSSRGTNDTTTEDDHETSRAELMLAYVAATRARRILDRRGLAHLDRLTTPAAPRPAPEPAPEPAAPPPSNGHTGRVEVVSRRLRPAAYSGARRWLLRDRDTGHWYVAIRDDRECVIFPADQRGEVTDWGQVAGRRGATHQQAIADLERVLTAAAGGGDR